MVARDAGTSVVHAVCFWLATTMERIVGPGQAGKLHVYLRTRGSDLAIIFGQRVRCNVLQETKLDAINDAGETALIIAAKSSNQMVINLLCDVYHYRNRSDASYVLHAEIVTRCADHLPWGDMNFNSLRDCGCHFGCEAFFTLPRFHEEKRTGVTLVIRIAF